MITKNLWYIFISHNEKIQDDIIDISEMMALFSYRNFLIFYGGQDLKLKNRHTIFLNCYDRYCGLPEKINKAFKYCSKYIDFDFIVKVDRTIKIKNLINPFVIPHDYCGHTITFKNTNYYFDKCKDENCFWHNRSFNGDNIRYCSGGGGYILSKRCVDIIAVDDDLYKENIYEDYYVGCILKKHNVLPQKIKLKNYLYDPEHHGIFK